MYLSFLIAEIVVKHLMERLVDMVVDGKMMSFYR